VLDLFGITEEALLASIAAADQPTKKWALAKARQLKIDGKITEDMSKTEIADLLKEASKEDAKAGKLKKQLKIEYIRNQLVTWGVWPIRSLK
jgi:hypothetical protein